MATSAVFNDLSKMLISARLTSDVKLATLSTFKSGSTASCLVEADSEEDLFKLLRYAHEKSIPLYVLGCGSNTLMPDTKLEGILLKLRHDRKAFVQKENEWTFNAGMQLQNALNLTQKASYSGMEWVAGIPGSIGGAFCMNAGTKLGTFGDNITAVTLINHEGIKTLDASAYSFRYRKTQLPYRALVSAVSVHLNKKTEDEMKSIKAEVRDYVDYRKKTQPLKEPSFGSTFMNPDHPEGWSAGKLIEACDLKGKAVGKASFSEKHANFIINRGGAKSEDAWQLIRLAQDKVKAQYNIDLVPEVRPLELFEDL